MENASFDFFPKSMDRRSMRRDAKPEPVPPEKEYKIFSLSIYVLLTSKGMEDEESLKTVGLVSKPLHSVHSHLELQIIARAHAQILDSRDDPVKEIENEIPQSAPFPQCSGPVRSYWQHPRDKPSNCDPWKLPMPETETIISDSLHLFSSD